MFRKKESLKSKLKKLIKEDRKSINSLSEKKETKSESSRTNKEVC